MSASPASIPKLKTGAGTVAGTGAGSGVRNSVKTKGQRVRVKVSEMCVNVMMRLRLYSRLYFASMSLLVSIEIPITVLARRM